MGAVYFLSSFKILCGLVASVVFGVTNAKYSSSSSGEASIGQEIKFSIYRQGQTQEITVPVGEQIQSALKEQETQQSQQTYPGTSPWGRP